MIFVPTTLPGAVVIEQERRLDNRGYFARTWCKHEFETAGLNADFVQANVSRSERAGTLRGMHWQVSPHDETKLVRCTLGSIWDVIIDLRPTSSTYLRHFGVELDAGSGRALYIPEGFAHGFVTLRSRTEVVYQMSNYYEPTAARGLRWNDPAFGIDWPVSHPLLHPRDASYPDFVPEAVVTATV